LKDFTHRNVSFHAQGPNGYASAAGRSIQRIAAGQKDAAGVGYHLPGQGDIFQRLFQRADAEGFVPISAAKGAAVEQP